jgi:hypothetical protein
MARIRTIKPEFWTNERIMECSMNARLMFIGMWNFADDLGRLPLSAKTIKAQIFPSDEISSQTILGMITELSANGLVLKYEVEGREYLQIVGWQHQRIDKPQAGKCPGPVHGYSKNDPGTVATEGKVEEGKGEESNSEAIASGAEAPLDPSIPEREYFVRGRQVLGKGAGGLIGKLLKSKGGNVALARAAIEQASTKEAPTEYIAAICRGPPVRAATVHQQKHAEGREILNELHEFNTRTGGGTDTGILRQHSSDGPESLRGGIGGNLIELSARGDQSRG